VVIDASIVALTVGIEWSYCHARLIEEEAPFILSEVVQGAAAEALTPAAWLVRAEVVGVARGPDDVEGTGFFACAACKPAAAAF